jgi:tRNA-dihydrouridine synthase
VCAKPKKREALSIPVVANGGVDELEDVERCLNETKADAYSPTTL